jgi:amino acid permease
MSSSHKHPSIIAAIGMLAGGIIGAGAFSLPYVFDRAGVATGSILLVIATIAYSGLHLAYADIIRGTPGEHRFVGYVRRYLGIKTSYLGICMAVIEMVFVLTIYLVLSISFTQLLFPTLSSEFALVLFWIAGSTTMFMKLRRLAFAESLVTVGIIAIIGALSVAAMPWLGGSGNASAPLSSGTILLPLSAILFSLSGRVAIPPLVHYLSAGPAVSRRIRTAVVLGTALPAVLYGIFVMAIIALSGSVSPDAVSGIQGVISPWLLGAVGVLGLLTLWSSYILVGVDVSDTLKYDLQLPIWLRLFIVMIVPPLLYVMGFNNFIGLIAFVGGIFLALEGAFIVLMWRKAKQQQRTGGIITLSASWQFFLWIVFIAALGGVFISRYTP